MCPFPPHQVHFCQIVNECTDWTPNRLSSLSFFHFFLPRPLSSHATMERLAWFSGERAWMAAEEGEAPFGLVGTQGGKLDRRPISGSILWGAGSKNPYEAGAVCFWVHVREIYLSSSSSSSRHSSGTNKLSTYCLNSLEVISKNVEKIRNVQRMNLIFGVEASTMSSVCLWHVDWTLMHIKCFSFIVRRANFTVMGPNVRLPIFKPNDNFCNEGMMHQLLRFVLRRVTHTGHCPWANTFLNSQGGDSSPIFLSPVCQVHQVPTSVSQVSQV